MDDKILKALGDPVRYRLLTLMAEHAYCVRALARQCGLSESAVSQHLKILREAGLVYGVKFGYYTHYRLSCETLEAAVEEIAALTRMERKPCDGPFRGCSEAAYVRCREAASPVPDPDEKGENDPC